MTLKYTNNVSITLASNLLTTDVTLTLTPGDGAQLPVIASGTADTFLITLYDKSGNNEIISICRRESGSDTLYVGTGTGHQAAGNIAGRAQESTTALAITASDDHSITLNATAAAVEAAVKYSDAGELTATTTEINKLAGATSTPTASKVVLADANAIVHGAELNLTGNATNATNTGTCTLSLGAATEGDYVLAFCAARLAGSSITNPNGKIIAISDEIACEVNGGPSEGYYALATVSATQFFGSGVFLIRVTYTGTISLTSTITQTGGSGLSYSNAIRAFFIKKA